MNKIVEMFLSFFKIGAFTFGGGYAMIPLIEAEIVDKKKWINKEEFLDILVISQSFPGALAVNCSIFVGYKMGGIIGAILALLGTILPSFFIILIIVAYFMQFRNNHYVDLAFKGIAAAVPMLVLVAVLSLSKSLSKSYFNIIMILLTIFCIVLLKLNPVIVILFSGLCGYLLYRKKVKE